MRGVTFSEFGGGKNVDMFVQAPISQAHRCKKLLKQQ